jgi:parvulin-like peptidyl-prolyl isomerase
MNNKVGGGDLEPPSSRVVSKDVLQREPLANTAQVKHILIGWKENSRDQRSQQRTKEQAEAEVSSVLGQIRAGVPFDGLMRKYSEDPGSAQTARAYKVAPDAQLVIEFKMLSLRLRVDEIGVCESEFGFHIIKRLE